VNCTVQHLGTAFPIFFHALLGHWHLMPWHDNDACLALIVLLSSHGALRVRPATVETADLPLNAEDFVVSQTLVGFHDRTQAVHAWLVRSRHWCTRLHHLDALTTNDMRKLLHAGHPIHCRVSPAALSSDEAGPPPPSPLDLATEAAAGGGAPPGSTARLLLTYHHMRAWRTAAWVVGTFIRLRTKASERIYAPGGRGFQQCREEFEAVQKRQRT